MEEEEEEEEEGDDDIPIKYLPATMLRQNGLQLPVGSFETIQSFGDAIGSHIDHVGATVSLSAPLQCVQQPIVSTCPCPPL